MRFIRFLAAFLIAGQLWSAGAHAGADPLDLYGEEVRFDIVRKGRTVGSHVVSFRRAGEAIETRSEVRIAIDVLIFKAFRYRYDSDARWEDGQLSQLTVDVDDNGKRTQLTAAVEGDALSGTLNSAAFTAAAPLYPTEHWNPGVLPQRRVLNTLTGKVNNVIIEPGAREYVATERGQVPATYYRYTGDLLAELWYDDDGRWVKMRFKGRDGSMIEYVCRRCQGPDAVS